MNTLTPSPVVTTSRNCTISSTSMNGALSILTRAISTRSTLPILGNILVDAGSGDHLELTATNLDLTIRVKLEAEINAPGSISVPGKLLSEYISSLPEGPCSLEINEEKLQLRILSAGNRTTFHGMAASEFPPVAVPVATHPVQVDAEELGEAITKTIVAASGDDAAAMLTGIAVQVQEGKLVLAATDRHRLAVTSVAVTGDGALSGRSAIVPARHMSEIARAIQKDQGIVHLSLAENGNQIFVESGEIYIASRLIEGNYPNFRQVIPSQAEQTLKISRTDFLGAVKTAAVMARETAHPVSLILEDSTLTLRSGTAEVGDHEVSMPAQMEGDPLDISFNARYLMDALGCISSDTVDISFSGKKNPCVIRPGDGTDYLHVIMPVKIPSSS